LVTIFAWLIFGISPAYSAYKLPGTDPSRCSVRVARASVDPDFVKGMVVNLPLFRDISEERPSEVAFRIRQVIEMLEDLNFEAGPGARSLKRHTEADPEIQRVWLNWASVDRRGERLSQAWSLYHPLAREPRARALVAEFLRGRDSSELFDLFLTFTPRNFGGEISSHFTPEIFAIAGLRERAILLVDRPNPPPDLIKNLVRTGQSPRMLGDINFLRVASKIPRHVNFEVEITHLESGHFVTTQVQSFLKVVLENFGLLARSEFQVRKWAIELTGFAGIGEAAFALEVNGRRVNGEPLTSDYEKGDPRYPYLEKLPKGKYRLKVGANYWEWAGISADKAEGGREARLFRALNNRGVTQVADRAWAVYQTSEMEVRPNDSAQRVDYFYIFGDSDVAGSFAAKRNFDNLPRVTNEWVEAARKRYSNFSEVP
jgi:hypothetical protein